MRAGVVNAGARLDRLPITRFHWKVLGLISAGAFFDSFDIFLAGSVVAAMINERFADLQTGAIFVSATFVGMTIGAGLSGIAGDRFGRRYSYQLNLALFGIASLLACFAPDIRTLIGLRFLMGVGMGAELVVASGTLLEFIPPASRGRWISMLGFVINSGLLAASAVGYYVIPALGWRWMFAVVGIGALFVWILRHRMPESPRWLESRGRNDEAEQVLCRIESEVSKRAGPLPPVTEVRDVPVSRAPLSRIFSAGIRGRTIVAALTNMSINVSLYGFVGWLPTFFIRQGLTVVHSLGFTLLMSFGAPVGALVAFVVADRLGRARGITVFALLTIALGFVYSSMRAEIPLGAVGFILVTSIYTITTLGYFGFIPELFPTDVRLRGTGFAAVCGRGTSIAMPYVTLALFSLFGVSGVLSMVSGMLGLLAIAIAALRIETGRHALEDIAAPVESESVKDVVRRPL
ncbi:MFS transporter [Trinickia mobilis]|uniref:MFS transporter n=1 Tax=Trinickia mobilis TaxID=2816356 RepID=UPI001A8FABA7|nr:MFS transporter [Trinickia mobilis]